MLSLLRPCSGILTLGLDFLALGSGKGGRCSRLETEMEHNVRTFLFEIAYYISQYMHKLCLQEKTKKVISLRSIFRSRHNWWPAWLFSVTKYRLMSCFATATVSTSFSPHSSIKPSRFEESSSSNCPESRSLRNDTSAKLHLVFRACPWLGPKTVDFALKALWSKFSAVINSFFFSMQIQAVLLGSCDVLGCSEPRAWRTQFSASGFYASHRGCLCAE
jgi:hypothetical protein